MVVVGFVVGVGGDVGGNEDEVFGGQVGRGVVSSGSGVSVSGGSVCGGSVTSAEFVLVVSSSGVVVVLD